MSDSRRMFKDFLLIRIMCSAELCTELNLNFNIKPFKNDRFFNGVWRDLLLHREKQAPVVCLLFACCLPVVYLLFTSPSSPNHILININQTYAARSSCLSRWTTRSRPAISAGSVWSALSCWDRTTLMLMDTLLPPAHFKIKATVTMELNQVLPWTFSLKRH